MVKVIKVRLGDPRTIEQRGNFLEIVDKSAGNATICYLDGKGRELVLPYDVQGAVLDLGAQIRAMNNDRTIRAEELRTTRGSLQEAAGRLKQAKEDQAGQAGTGNMTLGGFVAWAERVKALWVEEKKS